MHDSDLKERSKLAGESLDRREFLTGTGSVLASLGAWDRIATARPRAGEDLSPEGIEVVETPICGLRVDRRNGNLVGLTWKNPTLDLIAEPRLGENFRLLLPRPGYEANYFTSSEQRVSRIEKTADAVTCVYESLRNARETVGVKVRYQIRAVGESLEFVIEVDNLTDLPLAEVFFAIIGGQQGLGNRQDTESLVPGLNSNLAPKVFTEFSAGEYGGGNLGIRYDATGYLYPSYSGMQMGWIEFFNRKANLGLYYANCDPGSRLTGLYFELRPFSKSAVVGDNWPTPADVPAGEPIGLTMGWLKFPYLRRGTFSSGPVALRAHTGDWHEGSEFYRAWFDQHFQVKRPPTWLRKEMAWQSVILSNCEDVTTWKFKDLLKLAADAKKYGVTTFEIQGWDIGGIDRGYPQYHPNPRLGTPEEFRQALVEMKKLGVYPLIFTNIQVADTATPLFKDKLHRYAVMGRWAPDYVLMGFGEGTNSARMGLTASNMALVSPAHPEFRQLLMEQFVQLARDGAAGLQVDKTCAAHFLDFNPNLPTSPDKSLTQELLSTLEEITQRCREVNPEFALASEFFWDRSFPLLDVSYVRMNDIDMNSPALRYTFPEWTSTICAENPSDFNIINNGMRYGLVWAVQPRHYNDSMDEPLTRPLSRYVQELIRIRSKHKGLLFHGRFRDTEGAEVKAGKDVRYSVFEGMGNAGKACVVVNYGNEDATAEVTWPAGEGQQVQILKPFQPESADKLPTEIRLAPRTCAVVALE
jgi:hypothetical protein